MDTNEQLQQINTFVGGMDTDTSAYMLKPDRYRLAKNLKLISSREGKTGELHVAKNIEKYLEIDDVEDIIATAECRNYGIIVYNTKSGGWCIGRFDEDETGEDRFKIIFGPCDEKLGDSVSIVMRYETSELIHMYMVDGVHSIMTMNIKNELDTGDISSLSGYNNVSLEPAKITNDLTGGSVSPARVQYAYLLYKENGAKTQLSPLSKIHSVYKDGWKGFEYGSYTNRRVQVRINIPTDQLYGMDHIRVYKINYQQAGQLPHVHIIKEEEISNIANNVFEFWDSGGTSIELLSFSEFLQLYSMDIVPEVIESKNNYLFAANIKDTSDEFDRLIDKYFNKNYVLVYYEQSDDKNFVVNRGNGLESGSYTPTFLPGETYRLGIVFYSKSGKRSSVFHLNDATIPDFNIDTHELFVGDNSTPGNRKYIMKPLGLTIRVPIPSELKNEIDSFEIVREDKTINNTKTLAFGISGAAYNKDDYSYPAHYLTHDYLHNDFVGNGGNIGIFATPEYVYDNSFITNIKNFKDLNVEEIYRCTTDIGPTASVNAGMLFPSISGIESPFKDDTSYDVIPAGSVIRDNTNNIDLKFYGPRIITSGETKTGSSASGYIDAHTNYGTVNYFHVNDAAVALLQNDTDNYRMVIQTGVMSPGSFFNIYNDSSSNSVTEIIGTHYVDPWHFLDSNNNFIGGNYDKYYVGGCSFLNFTSLAVFGADFDIAQTFILRSTGSWKNDSPDGSGRWPDVESGGIYLVYKSGTSVNKGTWVTPGYISISRLTRGSVNSSPLTSTIYRSHGDFFKLNTGNNEYQNVSIYSGDCFLNVFNFYYLHATDSPLMHPKSFPMTYSVPMISRIDIRGTYGDFYPWGNYSNWCFFLDMPTEMRFYKLVDPVYRYNSGYTSNYSAVSYYSVNLSENTTPKFGHRIFYSVKKENGETIDNWLNFLPAQFLDVDTRFGDITQMKLFKDNLMFWQERAFGKLLVNERQLLLTSDNSSLLLGVGGVLDDYNYISTVYGMKSGQFNDRQSNYALYWWDGYNKQILQYFDNDVVTLQKTKNIDSYISSKNENDHQDIWYDQKTGNIAFNVVNSTPIVYNENVQRFISEWDVNYTHSIKLLKDDYFVNDGGIYMIGSSYLHPYIKYCVNTAPEYNKVFDNIRIGGTMPTEESSDVLRKTYMDGKYETSISSNVRFTFTTPLNQEGSTLGTESTCIEYDYKINVPRDNNQKYGGRLRGKYIDCVIDYLENDNLLNDNLLDDNLSNNDLLADFSLQYIITKFRISWT